MIIRKYTDLSELLTTEPDPFYSESNIRILKGRLEDIKSGKARLEEHELVEA